MPSNPKAVANSKKDAALQRLIAEADKATVRAEAAKEQVRLAKTQLKQARKASKRTRKAAKQARRKMEAAQVEMAVAAAGRAQAKHAAKPRHAKKAPKFLIPKPAPRKKSAAAVARSVISRLEAGTAAAPGAGSHPLPGTETAATV
jgi:hypothetical protein